MKIAIPYENGEVFQHFGKAQVFQMVTVEDGAVVDSQLVNAQGSGHDAIAAFLAEQQVEAVICGGIGEGAQAALAEAEIAVVPGVSGSVEDVIAALLEGQVEAGEAGCCGCGGEESCDCGGGCGGGGCHCRPQMEGKNVGKTCRVHYRGTFNDGSQFDSSYDRGEPLEFTCGAGMMIAGFDAAVANMDVGQVMDIHLMPEEAYGPSDPRAVLTIAIAQLPGSEGLSVGEQVYLYNAMGQPVQVVVTAKDDTMITLDANHPMAGKELNFRIELVEVK